MEIYPSVWTNWIIKLMHVKDLDQFLIYGEHVIAALFTFLFCVILAVIIRSKLRVIPGGLQQFIEVVMQAMIGMLEENMGKEGRKYIPIIGTLAFFIFISNLLGLIPTFSASTSNWNTTLACALIVFVYYNFQGLKAHGIAYAKQFMGPMIFLAPLMIPIEIISHLARPFSLSVRLFGNISGEHIVSLVFYSLVPFLVPVPLLALGLFAAFLQTFIFIMLTTLYISGAISHEH